MKAASNILSLGKLAGRMTIVAKQASSAAVAFACSRSGQQIDSPRPQPQQCGGAQCTLRMRSLINLDAHLAPDPRIEITCSPRSFSVNRLSSRKVMRERIRASVQCEQEQRARQHVEEQLREALSEAQQLQATCKANKDQELVSSARIQELRVRTASGSPCVLVFGPSPVSCRTWCRPFSRWYGPLQTSGISSVEKGSKSSATRP
jgi:hypothetical protein